MGALAASGSRHLSEPWLLRHTGRRPHLQAAGVESGRKEVHEGVLLLCIIWGAISREELLYRVCPRWISLSCSQRCPAALTNKSVFVG